jgi:hypothetical protein
MILIKIILIILILAMVAKALACLNNGWGSIGTFVIVFLLTVLFSVMLGIISGLEKPRTTKTPVNPSIEIKCVDGKCDTTYVYKFDEE